MSGAIPPFLQYTFMAWCSVKAQGQLHLTLPNLYILTKNILTVVNCCNKYRQQSPFGEANSCSGIEDTPHPSLNPKVHYLVRKSPPLDDITREMNAVHILRTHFFNIIMLPGTPRSSK